MTVSLTAITTVAVPVVVTALTSYTLRIVTDYMTPNTGTGNALLLLN
jgi:hypothetical protein